MNARRLVLPLCAVLAVAAPAAQSSFVHWETPHVHPLDMTPGGERLLAVNTPGASLEVFDLTCGTPRLEATIAVGLDPVSVRARSAREAWVVNHVSDSVSVVDLVGGYVVRTLATEDEPADVVFAGSPPRAFVSCSQADSVLVFDLADLDRAPERIAVDAEDPRALAVSPDGLTVYAAIFESGNRSTTLPGGNTILPGFPPDVVSDPAGPYEGRNPPPNSGTEFVPPIAPDLPVPPRVGLIVKQDAAGRWMDDNDGDWTDFVSGPMAPLAARPVGWTLLDHDVVAIDARSLAVSYVDHLMNLCMALGVNPASGEVLVVGTDARNEVRFQPNQIGRFLRVNGALVDPAAPATPGVFDLNPQLDYTTTSVPLQTREQGLGDPRGVAWNGLGTRAYVTGMGSNNLVVLDAQGARAGLAPTIEVGEGPTGVVFDGRRSLLYVLNKFEASISVVSTASETELVRVPFHDPSPDAIRRGRDMLYATHEHSGLGIVSCGSCHVDARFDRLAWDLGNPAGRIGLLDGQNMAANLPVFTGGFRDFHPMKGPMTTQTLQDIVGKEPFHWRGDRDGLEEFTAAFEGVLGSVTQPSAEEMQEFEDFLATISYPPNPYRNLDNTLPEALPLDGLTTTGAFGPKGLPLGVGDATRGLTLHRAPALQQGVACVTCHTLPAGLGTNYLYQGSLPMVPFPTGPNGEAHHMLILTDGSSAGTMKVPHLRNLYEKVGLDYTASESRSGFGFLHDGTVDNIAHFVRGTSVKDDQDVADVVAFLLSFSGSDLPLGSPFSLLEPPGTPSQDTHAAVGRQTTVRDAASIGAPQASLLATMLALAESGEVGLIVKTRLAGQARGFAYLGGGMLQSDRATEVVELTDLLGAAQPGSELTWTVVVAGSETRLGIDRDEDGVLDRDELDLGSDPDDPTSLPAACGEPAPEAPLGPTVAQRTKTSITLAWTDVATNETAYVVERAGTDPGDPFTTLATLPPDSSSFTDDSLPCGARFLYRVRAENCAGSRPTSCLVGATLPCALALRTRGGS